MIIYPIDYIIERTLENKLSRAQLMLKNLTGQRFNRQEAEHLFNRISDHKWYVSERLGRDIGLRVAAIDYLENLYEPQQPKRTPGWTNGVFGRNLRSTAVVR